MRLSGNSALRSDRVFVSMLDLHFVQHLPSKPWSNSGQSRGRHTTSRHRIGSALLFMPMPPPRPFAHDRSSGTLISLTQTGQQVPKSSGVLVTKGGTHSIIAHLIPSHGSTPIEASDFSVLRMSEDSTVIMQRSATITFIIGY